LPFHLEALAKTVHLSIEVNQLEIHPTFQQCETVRYCRERDLSIMAWSPLFKGKAVNLPLIRELAEKYKKDPAQIILRWDIQNGITPVVCSSNEERMRLNFDVFNFELSDVDMELIDNLNSGEHVEAYSYVRQQKSLKGVK
jgi:diketogulonate reductase-like aldo/keto reductase